MSGIHNPNLEFGDPKECITVSSPYRDEEGNQWRIDVTGHPEAVEPFVESRGLIIEAFPMTEEEYDAWLEKERDAWQSSLEEQRSAPTLHTASEEAQQKQEGDAYQKTRPQPEDRPPAMSIAITLRELAQEGHHRIHFEVDPEIAQWSSPQEVRFRLHYGDYTPNVILSLSLGSAWLSLWGAFSDWVAQVTWASGAPAYYTLAGDVVRY
jgi:hypothetical protein